MALPKCVIYSFDCLPFCLGYPCLSLAEFQRLVERETDVVFLRNPFHPCVILFPARGLVSGLQSLV